MLPGALLSAVIAGHRYDYRVRNVVGWSCRRGSAGRHQHFREAKSDDELAQHRCSFRGRIPSPKYQSIAISCKGNSPAGEALMTLRERLRNANLNLSHALGALEGRNEPREGERVRKEEVERDSGLAVGAAQVVVKVEGLGV